MLFSQKKKIRKCFLTQPEYQAFLGEKGKDGSEKGRELKERNA